MKQLEVVKRFGFKLLTPFELENLLRSTREADAYLAKAFKNHTVDLGVKDDAEFDTRAEATERDAPTARVDSAAQEQPGGVGARAQDGDILPDPS